MYIRWTLHVNSDKNIFALTHLAPSLVSPTTSKETNSPPSPPTPAQPFCYYHHHYGQQHWRHIVQPPPLLPSSYHQPCSFVVSKQQTITITITIFFYCGSKYILRPLKSLVNSHLPREVRVVEAVREKWIYFENLFHRKLISEPAAGGWAGSFPPFFFSSFSTGFFLFFFFVWFADVSEVRQTGGNLWRRKKKKWIGKKRKKRLFKYRKKAK